MERGRGKIVALSVAAALALFSGFALPALGGKDGEAAERALRFSYRASFPAAEPGAPLDIFIPLARSDEHQTIVSRKIDSPYEGEVRREKRFGNEFWHARVADSGGEPFTVSVVYEAKRRAFDRKGLLGRARRAYPAGLRERLAAFLGANERVPISGEFLDRLAADIPRSDGTPAGKSRAIYDFVIDTMEYKKDGTGWGNGDTFWACSRKYGNCTDFHALFISLARREGIPSRFEIGFPVPAERAKGRVGGYHCWVNVFLPGVGWVPIDASEAKKHPEKRDFFFGTYPPDRIKFTVGRDLVLGEGHAGPPLNYFVYPHAESRGKPLAAKSVKTEFWYETL